MWDKMEVKKQERQREIKEVKMNYRVGCVTVVFRQKLSVELCIDGE